MIEAELFGVEKGAYTGAHATRAGRFERADGGTLFLDEVGDIPLAMQVKLLRLLESGTYRRVGSTELRHADVRLVSATHRDLGAMVAQGRFREDLYYRLSTFPIALPPLRARSADIIPIAERYVRDAAPLAAHVLTPAAVAALQAYHWPGNLRELRAVMMRAVTIAPRESIDAKHLMLPRHGGVEIDPPLDESLDAMEWRHIQVVLDRVGGHQGRAAERLGISSKTLYRKIREHGVARDDSDRKSGV